MTGYTSAGVLPICIHNRMPYALLGREEFTARTRRWADFAGRKKSTDADEYETAAREFCEESVHCVTLDGVETNTVEAVAKHLRAQNFVLRLVIEKASKGKRILFVVMAQYDRGLVQRFAAVRAAHMHLERFTQRSVGNFSRWWLPGTVVDGQTGRAMVLPDYYEKSALQYWGFDDLGLAVQNSGTIPYTARNPAAYFRLDMIPVLNATLPILTDGSLMAQLSFSGAVATCPWRPS